MIIQGNSMTECWLKALIKITKGNSDELSPVVASFQANAPSPSYKEELEKDLNYYLRSKKKGAINTTANTIFPKSLFEGDSKEMYDRFRKILPNIKKDRDNCYGHYFERLVSYDRHGYSPFNQLQHIIDAYNRNVGRRSTFIASIFEPMKDHTFQRRRGFPCLQQVCFVPKGDKLDLNAIYAMQHLCNRAYGNYLGLQNLGNFMAGEMGLKLDKVNCIASVLKLKMTKTKAREIINSYGSYVE